MKTGNNLQGISPVQWTGWVVMFVAFLGALYIGNAVGTGNYSKIYLIFLVLGGMAVALFVGPRYWLIGIACFCINVPLVSMGIRALVLPEAGAIYLFGSYLLMLAFRRNHLNLNRVEYIGFALFIALVTLTLALNPVGFLGFGSQIGGARSYIKIYMALAVLLVLSNQIVNDKDLRWVIWIMVAGSFITLGWELFDYFILGTTAEANADEIYSWHQILAGPPFMLVVWLFSKYKPSEIVSVQHPMRLFIVLVSLLITFESGKRGMVAAIMLVPVISAIINRQGRYVYFLVTVLLVAVAIVIMGQGSAFSLPLRAQRALMYLPADWDQEIARMKAGGSMDEFRSEMRRIAWERALDRPWIGEGFALDMNETRGMGRESLQTDATGILSIGKAWHSLWFGLAADFGFMACLFYAMIYFTMLCVSVWIIVNSTPNTYTRTIAMMLFITFVISILKSNTSGHSANTPFGEWWSFGLLIAIRYSMLANENARYRAARAAEKGSEKLGDGDWEASPR